MIKKQIIVLGLKNFGMSIVKQLSKYNCEVLAIDKDMEKVEDAAEYATHAMQVDIKNGEEINELSISLILSFVNSIIISLTCFLLLQLISNNLDLLHED